MFQSKIFITTLFFIVSICLYGCSNEKNLSINNLEKVHEKIRAEQFSDIYDEGSISLKSCYSKEEFIKNLSEATQKLNSIDEKLVFWEAKDWEKTLNNGYEDWNLPEEYEKRQFYLVRGIGSDSNTDSNYDRKINEIGIDKIAAHELTSWENNNGKMKLVAYQVIGFDNGETKFYGNRQTCLTTISPPSIQIDLKQVIKNICTKIGC
ncbi:MAG TPA: hypothetical protein VF604_01405 [Pyrinomonadaceae bacterium]|jgi:hypothetical protein